MTLSIYKNRDYDDFCGFGRRKNKANSKPINKRSVFGVQMTASRRVNGIWKNKANLRMGRMSLSAYIKGDYEEFHALRRRENKAKQSQSVLAPRPALGVEKPIAGNILRMEA